MLKNILISYMEDIGIIGCGSVCYALYVQYNPKIGNVWIRPNSNGERQYAFRNLYNLIKEPLKSTDFWKIQNLDLNYFVFTSILWGVIKGVRVLIL